MKQLFCWVQQVTLFILIIHFKNGNIILHFKVMPKTNIIWVKHKIMTLVHACLTLVILTSSCMSYIIVCRYFCECVGASVSPFFKDKNAVFNGEQKHKLHYLCEDGIEKSVPHDNLLSPLGKPRDAKRLSSRRIFLSHPHTHDYSYIANQITSEYGKGMT